MNTNDMEEADFRITIERPGMPQTPNPQRLDTEVILARDQSRASFTYVLLCLSSFRVSLVVGLSLSPVLSKYCGEGTF